MEMIESILAVIGAIVLAATFIVKGLEIVAGITPTTKDDEFVSKLKRGVGYVSDLLDRFAVHPGKKPQ